METKQITAFPEGLITVPPSKSVAHRILICAALSGEGATVKNLQLSQDIKASLRCITALGGGYVYENNTLIMTKGIGHMENVVQMDCGESGSTLRFFIPIGVALSKEIEFIGAKRLFERPLTPYIKTLSEKGITITEIQEGIKVKGNLKAGDFFLQGDISSQFVTGLLFALPLLKGKSKITMTTNLQSKSYVDLTLGELQEFGINIKNNDYKSFEIRENCVYTPKGRIIEGDYSNAAFMLAAAALGQEITISGLGKDSKQGDRAFLKILEKVGAKIEYNDNNDIKVHTENGLKCVEIDVTEIPDLVPPIAVLLCFCKGISKITGAARLRLKESNRLKTVTSELNALGAKVTQYKDSLEIEGMENLKGGECYAHNDHRIAMMCAVAAIKCKSPVNLKGYKSVDKSYPTFWEDFCKVESGDYINSRREKTK